MATTLPVDTTKVNFDAGTDDPKQARSEFAANADLQNDLKDALGDFAQLSNPVGSGLEEVSQAGGTPDDVRVFHKHERKTANYLAVAGDRSKLLEFDKATAITLDLTAAATLTNGWFINVNNSGAGTLTIDPNGGELIDDAATITLDQNSGVIIFCDGAAFWAVGRDKGGLIVGTDNVLDPYAINTTDVGAHDLSAEPDILVAVVECKTAELNYSIGDRIDISTIHLSGGADRGFQLLKDGTNVTIITQSTSTMLILNKTTRTLVALTAANWKLIVTPYLIG